MAQYNLLGGVNPINPEYEQQQAMLGRGTNWAEYGLKKEALKEQKKQNKMNTIMNGINTAFKAYDAYQKSQEFELQKESQELINTEREIDIQSKRVDLDAKQTAATEDKEFLDGLMALTEAKKDNEIGAWLMSHPKAAQRNADATWGSINRLRTTLGDRAADQLLSYTLPEQAEKIRQFNVGESNANARAAMSLQGQRIAAASRIEAANIRAEGQAYKAELEAGAKIYGGIGGLMSSGGMSGIVNQEKATEAQTLQDNLKKANQVSYNSPDFRATLMRLGMLDDTGQLTLNTLRSYNARGNRIVTTDVKTVIDKMESMTGLSGADLLGFIQQYGAYEDINPQKTASGKQIKNITTKEDIIDLMSPYSSSVQNSIVKYLQQSIDTPDKEPTNSGEGIIQFVDANGRTMDAMIGTKDELRVFQDTIQSMIGYNSQLTESIAFTEKAANAMAKLGNRFGDSMARLGRNQLALLNAQNESHHIVPARNATTGEEIPGLMTQQTDRLPDKPILRADGSIGYTTKVNPEGEYYSTEQRAQKEVMFQELKSKYRENPEQTTNEGMKLLRMPNAGALTLDQINNYVDLKKPLSEAEFRKLSPAEKEDYYAKIRSTVGKILRDESIKEATENLRLPERNARATSNKTQQNAHKFMADMKAVVANAAEAIEDGENSSSVVKKYFTMLNPTGSTKAKIRPAITTALDSLDYDELQQVAELTNKLLVKLGREPISTSSIFADTWVGDTAIDRQKLRKDITIATQEAILDTVSKYISQRGNGRGYRNSSGKLTKKTNVELEQDIKTLFDLFDTLSKGA